jgi:hypothetical protein
VPSFSLDAGDVAELAEMLQFLSGWLALITVSWAHRWPGSPAAAPTASASCAPI